MIFARQLKRVKLEQIETILAEYENEYDSKEYEKNLALKGKTLGEANREQPAWFAYYTQRLAEIGAVLGHVTAELAKVRTRRYIKLTEGYSQDLNITDKNKYVEGDESVLEVNSVLLEVKELYEKYKGIVAAFEQRGYQLRNLTELAVAEMKDNEI